jgi:hypothetical protein
MSRFKKDKYREEVLGEFLETRLYPNIATRFERVSTTERQKLGHDVIITFDWLAESVVADEKAQNSDKWLNDPSPTFVMEIFGESWFTNDTPCGNIGWFVDKDNETEYYVLVWLPDVSVFKLTDGVGDFPYLAYRPAKSIDFVHREVADTSQSNIRDKFDSSKGEYRLELTPDAVGAFETAAEQLPEITKTDDADHEEWYYDPQHIHEAKVAAVQKEKIREMLAEEGLTREVLLSKARQAIEEGTVNVNSKKASCVLRSSGNRSGSADGEAPVVLVVYYDTYHEIADRTFHYVNGSWSENTKLF